MVNSLNQLFLIIILYINTFQGNIFYGYLYLVSKRFNYV